MIIDEVSLGEPLPAIEIGEPLREPVRVESSVSAPPFDDSTARIRDAIAVLYGADGFNPGTDTAWTRKRVVWNDGTAQTTIAVTVLGQRTQALRDYIPAVDMMNGDSRDDVFEASEVAMLRLMYLAALVHAARFTKCSTPEAQTIARLASH